MLSFLVNKSVFRLEVIFKFANVDGIVKYVEVTALVKFTCLNY